MSLPAGTRLGPYEIAGPLGAGAMGDVYRARDTRLDRPVAIKVLAEAIAADPAVQSRFEREARHLGAGSSSHLRALRRRARKRRSLSHDADQTRLAVHGQAVPVIDAIGYDNNLMLADFSVSQNDVIAYTTGQRSHSELTWVDRRGNSLEKMASAAAYANVAVSRDGARVASGTCASGGADVWLFDSRRGTPSRLTFEPSRESHPQWSPDGQQIAFSSDRDGIINLYRKPTSGGTDELLLASDEAKYPSQWTRDGRYLIYDTVHPDTRLDIWYLPLTGDRKPLSFLRSAFDEWLAQLSPDGRWISYTSNDSGRYEVYVQAFPPSGAKWQISSGGGLHARWRADQKELFYIDGTQRLIAVPVRPGGGFEYGAGAPLFEVRIPNIFTVRSPYDVSPDGQRFLLTKAVQEDLPLTVTLNWLAGLRVTP